MLTWIDHYIVDEDIKKPDKVKHKIDHGKLVPGIFLITLSSNPDNMLEIFSALSLKMPAFRELCQPIVGIAKSPDRAIEMIMELLDESMKTDYKADLVSYIMNR